MDQSETGVNQLLNCRNCDWHEVVDGSMMLADYEKEVHEKSIRNGYSEDACPSGSVAWVSLREGSEVA